MRRISPTGRTRRAGLAERSWPVALILSLLPAGLAFLVFRLSAGAPEVIESLYSRGLYRVISRGLSLIAGLVPFSLAEALVWSLLILVPALILLALYRAIRPGRARRRRLYQGRRLSTPVAARRLTGLVLAVSLAYAGFVLLWGLNYARQPFNRIAGLEVRPASVEELADLCAVLIDRANTLRLEVHEDPEGVMTLNGTGTDALRRAQLGYDRIAERYPVLSGRLSRPKGVLTSKLWSYTGTAGMYFPFTGEANVNIAMPASSIPFVACHEMAHQHGFAREDEANYIGYLACRLHPDADFRYSGALAAAGEAMRRLYGHDRDRYNELASGYSDAVRRDLVHRSAFWQAHQGHLSEVSTRVNDSYLRANLQTDGVLSYGRMVDLLLAESRASPPAGDDPDG